MLAEILIVGLLLLWLALKLAKGVIKIVLIIILLILIAGGSVVSMHSGGVPAASTNNR